MTDLLYITFPFIAGMVLGCIFNAVVWVADWLDL